METSLNFISYITLLKIHPHLLHARHCLLLLFCLKDLIGCNGRICLQINCLNFTSRHNFLQSAEHSHVLVTVVCRQEWQITLMSDGTETQSKGSESSRISSIHPFVVTIFFIESGVLKIHTENTKQYLMKVFPHNNYPTDPASSCLCNGKPSRKSSPHTKLT